jgi:hypothetical protein
MGKLLQWLILLLSRCRKRMEYYDWDIFSEKVFVAIWGEMGFVLPI